MKGPQKYKNMKKGLGSTCLKPIYTTQVSGIPKSITSNIGTPWSFQCIIFNLKSDVMKSVEKKMDSQIANYQAENLPFLNIC